MIIAAFTCFGMVPGVAFGVSPLIDIDPRDGVLPLQVQEVLSSCIQPAHMSIEMDFANWSYPIPSKHLQWRNTGKADPYSYEAPLVRHQRNVEQAIAALNKYMQEIKGRDGQQEWRPLVVELRGSHTVVHHQDKQGFLHQCRVENRTREPRHVSFVDFIESCEGAFTDADRLYWSRQRWSKLTTVIEPRSTQTLFEALADQRFPWYYICDYDPESVFEHRSCNLVPGNVKVLRAEGALQQAKSWQHLGTYTGCDLGF